MNLCGGTESCQWVHQFQGRTVNPSFATMLRFSRVLRTAAHHGVQPVKLTTGITGLDVIPNAREVLIRLYEKTLSDVQIMSADVPYRQIVEETTKRRLDIVKKHEDVRSAGVRPLAGSRCFITVPSLYVDHENRERNRLRPSRGARSTSKGRADLDSRVCQLVSAQLRFFLP
jgi:hypothetical protein